MALSANWRLTEEQKESAVEMYASGASIQAVATHYGVSRQGMWDILRRRTGLRPQRRYGQDNHFYRGGARSDAYVHDVTEHAIRSGTLTRPDVCDECGESGLEFKDGRHPIQAHHADYNKPFEVMWLCQPCHHLWHRENVPVERRVP